MTVMRITASRQATPRRPVGSNLVAMIPGLRRAAPALLVLAAACTASESEVRPPLDTLLFPTAVAVSPDDSVAFIVTGNSDLAFDSGTVQVLDLDVVAATVRAWTGSGTVADGCKASVEQPETLDCGEAPYLLENAAVRIGNFASAVGVQELGGGRLRLLVPVRGDPSLTWMEWDPVGKRLECSGSQGFALCDDSHRLTRLEGDSSLPAIPDEPYGIYVDSMSEFAMVSHFTFGTMSLIDSPRSGPPVLVDAVATGISAGLSGIAGRKPGPDNMVYLQSRANDRVFLMTVARPSGETPFLVSNGFFVQNAIGSGDSLGGSSDDSRGIVFSQGGDRAYMVNRRPPSLQVLDTSIGIDGVPKNQLIASADICRKATSVSVADTSAGDRAYVTCYATGELYTIDPRGASMVEATTLVGRGPISSAVVPSKRLLLIANFLDNAVAVVDIDPTSPTAYHVVARIGGGS